MSVTGVGNSQPLHSMSMILPSLPMPISLIPLNPNSSPNSICATLVNYTNLSESLSLATALLVLSRSHRNNTFVTSWNVPVCQIATLHLLQCLPNGLSRNLMEPDPTIHMLQ